MIISASSATTGQDELTILDDHPDAPRWRWRVEGAAMPSSPGAMRRYYDESGVIQAELAGAAVDWLVNKGPMWDRLDTDDTFTITVTPDERQAEPQA